MSFLYIFFFINRKPLYFFFFFFSSRRRHTRLQGDRSSDVCSSDLRRLGDGPHRVDEQDGDAAPSDTSARAGSDPGGVSCAWRLTRPASTRRWSSSTGGGSSPPTTGSGIGRIRRCWSDWTRS